MKEPETPTPTASRGAWPNDRVELGCVFGALGVSFLFQWHALGYHGYWGQDWIAHKMWIMRAATHPWDFFMYYEQGRTNPPLYDLLGSIIWRLAAGPYRMPAIGLMNVIFGLAGSCCMYGVVRRLIRSRLLRIACMVLILFLPYVMIHGEVVANEALATPLFWLLLWLMLRFPVGGSNKAFWASVTSIGLLLLVGLFTKFTFGSFVAASAVWIVLLWWTRLISGRRLAAMLPVIVIVPVLVGYREAVRFRSHQPDPFGIQSPSLNLLRNGWMNLRSVVWVRPADIDVLSAPPYNRVKKGQYDLLVSNKHSLPALMHLGVFTDILNIFQYDPYDGYFGSRTLRSHRRMEIAVRSGILISLLAIIGVAVLTFTSTRAVVWQRSARELPIFTVLLCCGAWFVNIAGILPFIPGAYDGGYWLPRFVAPSLLGFFMAGFVLVDRVPRRNWHIAVLVFVAAQSAVHGSFLWPTKNARRFYDANADIASSQAPAVLRVFNWPDQYLDNPTGEYWLDRTLGLVVTRPEKSQTEKWLLNLTLTPGHVVPESRRVVSISARDIKATLVDFDRPQSVELEIPLGGGRNDIVVQLVAPETVPETPGDPLTRLVQVSAIALRGPGGVRVTTARPLAANR